jgi:hypothetical protein
MASKKGSEDGAFPIVTPYRGRRDSRGTGVKALGVVEFSFDGAMDTFEIRIGVGAGRRVEAALGAEAQLDGEMETFVPVLDCGAIEFSAQIGGEDDWASTIPLLARQRHFLSSFHVHHHGEGAKDLRLRPGVDGPELDFAGGRPGALDLAEDLDDVPGANRRGEIELTEQFGDEMRLRERQRGRIVGHVIGPLHQVPAEERAAVV